MPHDPSYSIHFEGFVPPELQMQTDFKKLPFVLPKKVEDHEKINKVLRFNLRQQSADEISDMTSVVTHLVSCCLNAINVVHRIAFGFRRTFPVNEPEDENDMDFSVAPHVWLVIKNYIVDVTYMLVMPEKNCKYVFDNYPGCYQEVVNYNDPSVNVQNDVPTGCPRINQMKEQIDFCTKWPDKALALNHNNEHFYNYFFSMVRYMYEEHGVIVKGIDPKIRLMCWCCESYPQNGRNPFHSDTLALRNGEGPGNSSEEGNGSSEEQKCSQNHSSKSWRFLQCGRCMVASYCSEACQKRHWRSIHQSTCTRRGTIILHPPFE